MRSNDHVEVLLSLVGRFLGTRPTMMHAMIRRPPRDEYVPQVIAVHMRISSVLTSALLLQALACAPPPAPVELDELCAYLFAHAGDESTRELEAGIVNLDTWLLANLDDTLDGYSVTNLSETAVDVLDDRNHNVEEMLGAAVGTISEGYDPYAYAIALTVDDPVAVIPDAHEDYERTFLTDTECWIDLECDSLETTNHLYDNYPIIGDVDSENYSEFRWVETDKGLTMVQRSWLTRPSEVEWDNFELNDQYYLNVLLPMGQGTLTLQSMWVDAQLNDSTVSESLALNLVISQMQNVYAQVEIYLDSNGAAVQPDGCSSTRRKGGGSLLLGLFALLGIAWRRRR